MSDFRYAQALDDLQARYRILKAARPTRDVAPEMDVSIATLHRFEREGYVSSATLHKIATWVKDCERAQHEEYGYGR